MKILKPKIDTIVKCDCGCEFEFELKDTVTDKHYMPNFGAYEIYSYVLCPMCKKQHTINFEERTIKEQTN